MQLLMHHKLQTKGQNAIYRNCRILERELKTNKDEYEDSNTQVNEIVLF